MSDAKTSNPTTKVESDSSPKDKKSQTGDQTNVSKPIKTENTESNNSSNAPFAPPPKPTQSNQQGGNDYFNAGHNNAHFSLEPNPFEQSFGQPPSAETPGKQFGGLPSVQSLTSPAPLGPGGTPDWQNSLRSGPLSPAMLTGPTNSNGDYFDGSFRQSFPTPNESSLRSGLTPGGPSMFPAPSPNSQALFNNFQSQGQTPGTLDFQRSAASAAQRNKGDQGPGQHQGQNMQGINKQDYQPAQQQQLAAQNPFNNTNNSESDAVNSLYMLANNGQRNQNQFSMGGQQQQQQQHQQQGMNRGQPQMRGGQIQHDSAQYHRAHNASIGNASNSTGAGMSENGDFSDGSVDDKSGRGRTRRQGNKGNTTSNGGRRKADETPAKGQANKKQKGNNGQSMNVNMNMNMDMDDSDDNASIKNEPETGRDGKKLTDEEKRKNFLERNRVAALKCRQRKKQWLANLQAKVEIFTTENDALTTQCAQLREENQNLKALLYQHKDCAVSHQQGLGGARMAQVLGAEFESGPQPPPQYGAMGQPNMMGQGMHGQGMQS